jgi:hypothetical protein
MKKSIIYIISSVIIAGLVFLSVYLFANKKNNYESNHVCPDHWTSYMKNSFTVNGTTFEPSAEYVEWVKSNCSVKPEILD